MLCYPGAPSSSADILGWFSSEFQSLTILISRVETTSLTHTCGSSFILAAAKIVHGAVRAEKQVRNLDAEEA